jgi:pimeloyl-ACP methyl ester carboxylesterase
VPELAADVLRLVDEQGVSRFSFCGLSLGGMVGMWLGANAADRIDLLVLACTSARFGAPPEWEERAAFVRRQGMSSVATAAIDKWFTAAYEDRNAYLQMQLDFREQLGRISVPTLVIAGAEDEATPVADAEFIVAGIPDARLVVIEGAAHLANVEQPSLFTDAVLEHLDA